MRQRRLQAILWRLRWSQRWAHHPLCEGYRAEVLRVGRHLRLCHGCALGAVGLIVGTVLALVRAASLGEIYAMALLAAALGGASFWHRWRLPKLASRLLPGILGAYALTTALGRAPWLGLLACPGAALAWRVGGRLRRRLGPWRQPCLRCPQRGMAECDGLRAYGRVERLRWRLRA